MSVQNDSNYHTPAAYVHVGALHAFTLAKFGTASTMPSSAGISLGQIGLALATTGARASARWRSKTSPFCGC